MSIARITRNAYFASLLPWQRLLLAVLVCGITTAIATPLRIYLDLANIVMLFLLTVLVIAVSLGRSAAILASALSVLLFDIFFVPPRFSLAVSNIQYVITFAVMLATALVTSHLTSGLMRQAEEAVRRERTTQALYTLARELAGTLGAAQMNDIVRSFVADQFKADAWIFISADHGAALSEGLDSPPFPLEDHLLKAALQGGQTVNTQTPAGSGSVSLYIPLKTAMRTRGALAIALSAQSPELTSARRQLLETLASLVAVAVERLHYVDVAQHTQLNMISERLRSSILSALSHDLRTPLTVLVGLADSLSLTKPPLPPAALDIAESIRDQATRLANLVGNLLDMARLNAGNISLRREWQPLDDVIGASIKLLGTALREHPVGVDLPDDLPLLEFDAVLIERVLCNLLENAAKFAPPNSRIEIAARRENERVTITVSDSGPGFPNGSEEKLFAMFARGSTEMSESGAGLGLAICRAIVEAHGGTIGICKRNSGDIGSAARGGCVYFTLPLGEPPVVEVESV
ncbi:MAG TPA: DUF4118 domain-containing protein [Spongiibacteraceae bacterium]|nr:DUF4118 domain-containing protein [Spongiibacteraceae bacterium]